MCSMGPALVAAVKAGKVPTTELNDHVHRVLRTMFADGVVDDPPKKQVPDVFGGAETAKQVERAGAVLLRNEDGMLPLDRTRVRRVVVIGQNADRGMISGGGSAQVDPPQGSVIGVVPEKEQRANWQKAVWFPGSPVAGIEAAMPGAAVRFADGHDVAAAAEMARGADVVLVYAYQWMAEGVDLPTLELPDGQDALIAAVAKANPRTVVVLETGGPVLMPWVKDVAAVMETWFSGTQGATAIADLLVGNAVPMGKLPVTFPLADADLPHPKLVAPPKASQEDWSDPDKMSRRLLVGLPAFPTVYDEGLKVGYKWYDAEKKPVLFPFGFGLSYTTFAYSGLTVSGGAVPTASFVLKNTGTRAGVETAEVYTTMPAEIGEPPKRLVGWTRVALGAGEERRVSVELPRSRFHVWDEGRHVWTVVAGSYEVMVGGSSQELPERAAVRLQ